MKYLDDPFKKVSYSFRVEERLLEDIKSYSNATGRKLPETFNYLLKKSLEGVNVNNTYLKNYEGVIINITFMEYQKHYTYGVDNVLTDTWYTLTIGATDYTNFNFEGLLYEVEKIPNNLDKWINGAGYISNNGYLHEGICFVIVPELILHDKVCLTQESITNCLKFIYFGLKKDNTLEIRSISYKDCFRRLKEAGNDKDLVLFKKIDGIIYNYSLETMRDLENITDSQEDINEYKAVIYYDLENYASTYNDGNIKSIEDKGEDLDKMVIDNEDIKEIPQKSTSTDYLKEIDNLKKELEAKDKEIKQYKEDTESFKNILIEYDKRLKELESEK